MVEQGASVQEPWYRDGLAFACTRCGHCCTGGSGSVRVSDEEIAALARRLELDEETFRARYTRRLRGGEISLREKQSRDCVFFARGHGCVVYADRPRQCRTWPFWSSVVHSRERWEEEARDCPGMNRGPVRDAAAVAALADDDGTAGGGRPGATRAR